MRYLQLSVISNLRYWRYQLPVQPKYTYNVNVNGIQIILTPLRLLLSVSCCLLCNAMYHHHLRWGGSTSFIPWPYRAWQSLTGIRGIWGLSGLWLVVTGPDNVQLVLIIWVLTGGRVGQWLVSDGGGEVVSYYYQDRRGQTGVLITTWHGGGGRPLSSGHKLQEITTNWCQWPGHWSWLLFLLTKPLIKQSQHSNLLPGLHSISAFLE